MNSVKLFTQSHLQFYFSLIISTESFEPKREILSKKEFACNHIVGFFAHFCGVFGFVSVCCLFFFLFLVAHMN